MRFEPRISFTKVREFATKKELLRQSHGYLRVMKPRLEFRHIRFFIFLLTLGVFAWLS